MSERAKPKPYTYEYIANAYPVHWRVSDGAGNRIATCYREENAAHIVAALNRALAAAKTVEPVASVGCAGCGEPLDHNDTCPKCVQPVAESACACCGGTGEMVIEGPGAEVGTTAVGRMTCPRCRPLYPSSLSVTTKPPQPAPARDVREVLTGMVTRWWADAPDVIEIGHVAELIDQLAALFAAKPSAERGAQLGGKERGA